MMFGVYEKSCKDTQCSIAKSSSNSTQAVIWTGPLSRREADGWYLYMGPHEAKRWERMTWSRRPFPRKNTQMGRRLCHRTNLIIVDEEMVSVS